LPWDFSLLTPLVLQLTFLIQIFFFLFFSRTIEKFSMEKIERGQFVDFNDKNSQIPSQSNFFFDESVPMRCFWTSKWLEKIDWSWRSFVS
jgi:hypothetical protein